MVSGSALAIVTTTTIRCIRRRGSLRWSEQQLSGSGWPNLPSSEQDDDADAIRNCADNCPQRYNADQRNNDGDSFGNACDNCYSVSNNDQLDTDTDLKGDACDNCLWSYNPNQADGDGDRVATSATTV